MAKFIMLHEYSEDFNFTCVTYVNMDYVVSMRRIAPDIKGTAHTLLHMSQRVTRHEGMNGLYSEKEETLLIKETTDKIMQMMED